MLLSFVDNAFGDQQNFAGLTRGRTDFAAGVGAATATFTPTPVPLPAAGWLMLAGLGGLGLAGRLRA